MIRWIRTSGRFSIWTSMEFCCFCFVVDWLLSALRCLCYLCFDVGRLQETECQREAFLGYIYIYILFKASQVMWDPGSPNPSGLSESWILKLHINLSFLKCSKKTYPYLNSFLILKLNLCLIIYWRCYRYYTLVFFFLKFILGALVIENQEINKT